MSVVIELDTTPPRIGILATGTVDPPTEWTALVTSSEDMGPVVLDFIDALSEHHTVGFERLDTKTLTLAVPTVKLPGGPATLKATVADLAYNVAVREFSVYVDAPTPYLVSHQFGRSYDVDHFTGRSYQATHTLDHE